MREFNTLNRLFGKWKVRIFKKDTIQEIIGLDGLHF